MSIFSGRSLALMGISVCLSLAGCAHDDNGFIEKSERELDAMETVAAGGGQYFSEGKYEDAEAVFKNLAGERTVSQPLYRYELISIKIMEGKYDEAHELMVALKNDTDFLTDEKSAAKAKSWWHGEQNKVFKGDPYERATLNFLLALSFLRKNDPENALACVKSGLLFDADTEKGEFSADFALLQFTGALCLQRMGNTEEAEEWRTHALRSLEARGYTLRETGGENPDVKNTCFENLLNSEYNTLLLVWAGSPPTMTRTGEYKENRVIIPGAMSLDSLILEGDALHGRKLFPPKMGDLNYQAMTRGKRLMNDILQEKAFWKLFINVTSTALVTTGVSLMSVNNVWLTIPGGCCLLVGSIGYIVAACINPTADQRYWKNLPGEFLFLPLSLPPGTHTFHLSGFIMADQVMDQEITFEVKEDVPVNLVNVRLNPEIVSMPGHAYFGIDRTAEIFSAQTQENPNSCEITEDGSKISTVSFAQAMIRTVAQGE